MTPGPDEITRCPKCHALHRCWSHGSGNMMGAVVWTDGRVVAPFSPEDRCVTRCPHCGEVFLRSAACVVGMLRPAWSRGRCDVRVTLQVVPSAARVDVMRLCREVFGWSLAEAKGAVDRVPTVLAGACHPDEAAELAERVSAVGAVMTCEPLEPPAPTGAEPAEWRSAPYGDMPTEPELVALAERLASVGDETMVRGLAWRDGNDPFRASGVEWVPYASRPLARANLERLLELLPGSEEGRIVRAEALRQLGRFSDSVVILDAPDLARRPDAFTLRALAQQGIERLSILAVFA